MQVHFRLWFLSRLLNFSPLQSTLNIGQQGLWNHRPMGLYLFKLISIFITMIHAIELCACLDLHITILIHAIYNAIFKTWFLKKNVFLMILFPVYVKFWTPRVWNSIETVVFICTRLNLNFTMIINVK